MLGNSVTNIPAFAAVQASLGRSTCCGLLAPPAAGSTATVAFVRGRMMCVEEERRLTMRQALEQSQNPSNCDGATLTNLANHLAVPSPE